MRKRILFAGLLAVLILAASFLYRETHAMQPKPAGPPLEYIGAWGVGGDGPGELENPTSLATDKLGNVFIADSGSGFIDKFAPEGKPLLSFQQDGLKHPQSIAVDSGGAIYVTDPVRNSVFVFLPGGDHYRELRLRPRPAADNLIGVAVGTDGLIHVLDSSAGKVFTYNPRFRLLQTWAPPGSGSGAARRFGAFAIGPDDFLYLANPSGGIMKFTREGHLVAEIGANASGGGGNAGHPFAVSSNYIFVMDADGRMLHVWTMDGREKLEVDLAPELGQGARTPPVLAFSPRHELLVLDAPEHRVLRYRVNF
jgi:NHL repeat